MMPETNRRLVLASRPDGIPGPEHFQLEDTEIGEPGAGEVLVRNVYLSVDPAQRGWVSAVANYSEPVAIGAVMRALAVGEVVRSRSDEMPEGAFVTGMLGWQDYAVVPAKALRTVDPAIAPISAYLGVLGINGLSAYFGLLDKGQPKPGETVVVSTAAGAVGSCVGQIAKILGCRAVGIAGGPEKVALCREAFGYDAAIDYKGDDDLGAALDAACGDGIDVFFDNTGGAILDAVMGRINIAARIVICGTAATSRWDPPPMGPRIERAILVNRARIQGFLIFDHAAGFDRATARLAKWIDDGRIVYREDIADGIENAPAVLAGLYEGRNTGKALVRIRPDPTR
jgi:hypothetical protein